MIRASLRPAVCLLAALAANLGTAGEHEDLYFGEALFYAHQGQYFAALERLDTEVRQHYDLDEPELDTLWHQIDDAEFSLGDFELRYRMHHRAGRAIRAVLEGAVDETIRNDAAFRLARIHFQKGQIAEAMHALERIEGQIPESIRDDIEFLRANVYLAQERPVDAAATLEALEDSDSFGGFASYNLGIAYLRDGRKDAAREQLARAGQIRSSHPSELAIRDKSNLVLGTLLLEDGDYEGASTYLNRVRLDGPFSNQALLSAGWASMSANDFERAVVPWRILADRNVTDAATQEALLALPFAYAQLNVHGRAAVSYGHALDAFGAEVDRLNASIDSIRKGRFLEALTREEIRKDMDWVIQLRSLPETPETYYLMELVASHDFQTGLRNYLDLADLRERLLSTQTSLGAFREMVDIRHQHYEPLLPDVDERFRALDSRMRLRIEQHRMLVKRRDDLLTTPRPEFLATPEEQVDLERIARIQAALAGTDDPAAASLRQRAERLKGLFTYTLRTEYHERLTTFDRNLRGLSEVMASAQAQYDQYVRTRQAATHSYVGYDSPINGLKAQAKAAVHKIDQLMARQGRMLEIVAIDELVARRGRLQSYGDKARFALADSYDRATQSQARVDEQ